MRHKSTNYKHNKHGLGIGWWHFALASHRLFRARSRPWKLCGQATEVASLAHSKTWGEILLSKNGIHARRFDGEYGTLSQFNNQIATAPMVRALTQFGIIVAVAIWLLNWESGMDQVVFSLYIGLYCHLL